MAMCYLRGHMGVEQNIEHGRALLQQASNTSDPDSPQSSYVFGLIQLNELPAIAPPDPTLSYSHGIQAIERAAWVGFGPALLRMGLAWQGGEKGYDSCIALRYFHIASRQQQYLRFKGDLSAGLGGSAEVEISKWMLCGSVDKFPPNEEQAFYFAKLASEQENGLAEFAVGYFYEVGIHVKQDIQSALIWYGLAASHDNKDAADRLKALSNNRSNTITKQQHHRTLTQKGRGSIRSFKKKIECPKPMKYYPDLTSNDLTSRSDSPSKFRLSSLFSRNSNHSQTPPDVEPIDVNDNYWNQPQQQIYNISNSSQNAYDTTFSNPAPIAERIPSPAKPEHQSYRRGRRSLPSNAYGHYDNSQAPNFNSMTQTPDLSYNKAPQHSGYAGRRGFSASNHPITPINNRPVSPSKGYRRSSSPPMCNIPSPVQEHVPSLEPVEPFEHVDEGISNFYGPRKPSKFPGSQSFALSSSQPSIHNLPSPEHSPERQSSIKSDLDRTPYSNNIQAPSTPLPSPKKEQDIKFAGFEAPVVPTELELENSLNQYEQKQKSKTEENALKENKKTEEVESKETEKDTPKPEITSKEEKKKSGFFGYLFGLSAEPAPKEKKEELKPKAEDKKNVKEAKPSEKLSDDRASDKSNDSSNDPTEDKAPKTETDNLDKSNLPNQTSNSSTENLHSASLHREFTRAKTAPILENPATAGKFRAPSPRKPVHTNSLHSLQSSNIGNIDLTPPVLFKNGHNMGRHSPSSSSKDRNRKSSGSNHSSTASTISSNVSSNSEDTSITAMSSASSLYASSMKSGATSLGSGMPVYDSRNPNVIVVQAIPSTGRAPRTFEEMGLPVAKNKEDCVIM